MVDLHGPYSCFEECQRFLNLYRVRFAAGLISKHFIRR